MTATRSRCPASAVASSTGSRFAVIVGADDHLRLSTVIVCPTSRSTPPASFHPVVTVDDAPTRLMCEMVGAVDAQALGKPVGRVAVAELRAGEDALGLDLR